MSLYKYLFGLVAALTVVLTAMCVTAVAQFKRSDTKVKVKAVASKIDETGIQVVSVKIKIEKGWNLYANRTENKDVQPSATKLAVKGQNLKSVRVSYPKGDWKNDRGTKYRVYKNEVTITAFVERTDRETTPLELALAVSACNKNSCLFPATIKIEVE